jgi:hypothetical protein
MPVSTITCHQSRPQCTAMVKSSCINFIQTKHVREWWTGQRKRMQMAIEVMSVMCDVSSLWECKAPIDLLYYSTYRVPRFLLPDSVRQQECFRHCHLMERRSERIYYRIHGQNYPFRVLKEGEEAFGRGLGLQIKFIL